jgi:alpha,alpha-trehalase
VCMCTVCVCLLRACVLHTGIAATLYATRQQWDWPNGWPPLQHMLIEGAAQHGGARGRAFACRLTQVWLE